MAAAASNASDCLGLVLTALCVCLSLVTSSTASAATKSVRTGFVFPDDVEKKTKRPERKPKDSQPEEEQTAKSVRRGFVFPDEDDKKPKRQEKSPKETLPEDEEEKHERRASSSTPAFTFHAKSSSKSKPKANMTDKRKSSKRSESSRKKERKPEKDDKKDKSRSKKKETDTQDAQYEGELQRKYGLSDDQMGLYHTLRYQIKREIRRTTKEFATSSARRDIMQLSTWRMEQATYWNGC